MKPYFHELNEGLVPLKYCLKLDGIQFFCVLDFL